MYSKIKPDNSFSDKDQFLTGLKTFNLFNPLFDQLDLSGLYGKIGLSKGDLDLARVPILGDEIAGVAGEYDVVNFTLRTGADLDHFADVSKMIGHL